MKFDYGTAATNIVTTFVNMNGQVLTVSQISSIKQSYKKPLRPFKDCSLHLLSIYWGKLRCSVHLMLLKQWVCPYSKMQKTACEYAIALVLILNQCFSTHRMARVTNCFRLSALGCKIKSMVFTIVTQYQLTT